MLHLNTLDWRRWDETVKQQDWIDVYNNSWRKLRKLLTPKSDYRNFRFDVLMANPPFAGDIQQTDMLAPYDLAHKAGKNGSAGKLETAVEHLGGTRRASIFRYRGSGSFRTERPRVAYLVLESVA